MYSGFKSERRLAAEMGISRGKVRRDREKLRLAGELEYEVTRRGTWYRVVPQAEPETVPKAEPKVVPRVIEYPKKEERERESAREQYQEGYQEGYQELVPEEVLCAWRENRGRPLIERELEEFGEWVTLYGSERIIGLIEEAWDWCTVEHMSMHYIRSFVEKRLKNPRRVEKRRETTRPAKEPLKATKPAKVEMRYEIPVDTGEEPWNRRTRDDPRRENGASRQNARGMPAVSGELYERTG